MGCPENAVLGGKIVFSVCSHHPISGDLADADAPPTYSVYAAENPEPLLSGVMEQLNGEGEVGFYVKELVCSEENGFVAGQAYTVLIRATVSGISAGLPLSFKVLRVNGSDVADPDLIGSDVNWIVRINDRSGSRVIGCRVWVTRDEAGTEVVEGPQHTDDQGEATFILSPGDYWLWKDHPSIVFTTNPEPMTVA